MAKRELRKEILALRDALPKEVRQEKSAQITNKVVELIEFQNANVVLLYVSMRSEVETTAICQEARRLEKAIYCPRVIGDKMEFYLVDDTTEFEISRFGVREPKIDNSKQFVPKETDVIMVLMPGAVFDKAGNRIGYGGGYYDKYLHWLENKVLPENICKVAIGYECQMVSVGRIEKEIHDICPDYVITEDSIIGV